MIPDVNVLGAFFRDGILGDEDRALVITANLNGLYIVTQFLQKLVNLHALAATIAERHVLCLGGRVRNSLLRA